MGIGLVGPLILTGRGVLAMTVILIIAVIMIPI
jgi:hypothetical protein